MGGNSFQPGSGRKVPGEAKLAAAAMMAYCRNMRFDIEFIRHDDDHPNGRIVRRNSGQFANEKDAEIYGLIKRAEEADGFRIWKGRALRKVVSVRSEISN